MTTVVSPSSSFTMVRQVGEGSFATVHMARRNKKMDGKLWFVGPPRSALSTLLQAVKVFSKSELRKNKKYINVGDEMKVVTSLDNLEDEIRIMQILNHPNVIRLYEVINDDINDKLYLVMDLVSRGQILIWKGAEKKYCCPFSETGLYTEDQSKVIFRQLLGAVEYLHLHKIVHRDLKPENVLIDSTGEIKLIDFGVAHIFEGSTMEDSKVDDSNSQYLTRRSTGFLGQTEGTIQFMPPECCSSDNYSGFLADIWALGCILYAMFYGSLPFYKDNPGDLFNALEIDISRRTLRVPSFLASLTAFFYPVVLGSNEVSEDGKHLLLSLLEKNPLQRITINEIFNHPWITGRDTIRLPRCKDILKLTDKTPEEKRALMASSQLLSLPTDANDLLLDLPNDPAMSIQCCTVS